LVRLFLTTSLRYVTLELDEAQPEQVKLLVPRTARIVDPQAVLQTFVNTVQQMAETPRLPLRRLVSGDSVFGLAHAALEKQALLNPSRPAIRTVDGDLSYGEFNSRAESFAQHLIDTGVDHGEMIPLYMEKSKDTLVAIFGILKAGAAFVPLDPRNPHERNMFIINDTKALRIVTDDGNREVCAAFNLPMILSNDVQVVAKNTQRVPRPGPTPDSIAYAIYTSGSTGVPKGVLVPHSAVDAATEGMIDATDVDADWIALWTLNYIFDASYYDVFTIFATGGILCVAPQDEILGDLAGHINRMGVKQVMLTPTLTKLIRGGPASVPALKVLNVCGERIDTNVLAWAEHVDVYNG
jgi:non-ribosomal peptide synthetase component F